MTEPDLAMMGTARVRRTHVRGRPAIHKQPVTDTEGYFYREVMTQPAARAIRAPDLLAAAPDRSLWLEYIPHPLSMAETADPAVMQCLASVHEAELALDPERLFPFQWHVQDTERALARFEPDQQRLIQDLLPTYYDRQSALFDPIGLVSGDTNVFNWGRRDDGSLVLFDWERFGRASPAMDLAPLIPGLSDADEVIRYCRAYRTVRPSAPHDELEMTRQVLTAMAWLVIEVVSILHDRGNPQAPRYMAWLNRDYAAWLRRNRNILLD